MNSVEKRPFREFWRDYWPEVLFGFVLALVVVTSTWFSQFIPDKLFDDVITPAMMVATVTVAFFGAAVVFIHSHGYKTRILWGVALVVWGLSDFIYLIGSIVAPAQVMDMSAEQLTMYEVLLGNLLGWVLTLYPTETLRPGWLNWQVVLWQLIPLCALVALDYFLPYNLMPIVALYPYLLLAMVLTHIRAYRIWCEENYSSMDDISVEWIVRYCIMFFIIGANYIYMLSGHGHARGFTQQWFVVFMLAYSTEQILYRKNPWANIVDQADAVAKDEQVPNGEQQNEDNSLILRRWMLEKKPYLSPDFNLMDLQAVLPMNRTYLSQLIHAEYDCSFYQFVTRYRIEEAQRLMRENPDMKVTDIAARSGFSSPVMFSRVFLRETGFSPKEWAQKHNKK